MINDKAVRLEIQNRSATIVIDNPPVNALNSTVMEALSYNLDLIERERDLRALIITGAGEKAFVAGADISQFLTLTPETGYSLVRTGQAIFDRIEALEIPVIAAINGFALGGGCELALACDIRVAAQNAKFGQPEVNLGIIPGYGGTQRLPRVVGSGKAKELILTGNIIDAAEAYRIGLADILVPAGEALAKAFVLAQTISEKGPLAVKAAKKAIDLGMETSVKRGLEIEARLFSELCDTKDQKEGARAFLAKYSPVFHGE